MKREEFITAVGGQVKKYIDLADKYGKNAQIRVNPDLLLVDLLSNRQFQQAIGFSDEAIENAAYAEGDETMSAGDYQAKQDPDLYPVTDFIKEGALNELLPDYEAIGRLADKYFK